jgi:hypothetical protein
VDAGPDPMDPLIDVIDESAGVDARWFVAVG